MSDPAQYAERVNQVTNDPHRIEKRREITPAFTVPRRPGNDEEVEALVDLMIQADKTVDSPTVFTRWHHYAEYILSAGYRKGA